ncbi:unnamed protein product [Diamesa hyperborea]
MLDDKVKKNTLQIHKEATVWSKKIHIVYEKLLLGSQNFDRKTIVDAIRFYGPNFQRLPECVESTIKLMKCFLMSSGDNNECWDLHQKNAFNVFVSAMISQKKEDFIIRKVLGCWSDFLTKLPEEQCAKLINCAKSSKIIKMLFHKLGQARTYFTQMRLVEILHIYSKYLPDGGFKLMEDVKFTGSSQLYDQLHILFIQINIDDFVETSRRFLNFYNTYLGKKNGIVSMLGRLRILNQQIFSKNDIHSDFFDFNGKCLSMSFFIPKKYFTKNVLSTERIYVEIEDFEIDTMEFDDFTDPTEKNIQLSIHPIKYFILDSAGKTVHNIPELEKLVIEINDENSKKKNFRENLYANYKNRTKNHDDATATRDDESLMSFATYNTDFCNNSMIEQVKNRNLSINASLQEIEPASTQDRIINIFNSSPQKLDISKTPSDIFLTHSQKQHKQSEELYSSIDYGRRHEQAVYQIEKAVQKVRPMQEIPPNNNNIQIEQFQPTVTSVPIVHNKRAVKLPQMKRTEALRQDVYEVIDDDGDAPVIPYSSFISQERERKKKLMLQQSNALDDIIPDSEDFTLEDNLIAYEEFIPKVAKTSTNKKAQVKRLAQPKRTIQTRSKKEPAGKNVKKSPVKKIISLPDTSSKPPTKSRKLPVIEIKSPAVLKNTRNSVKSTRKIIISSSSSEDEFDPNMNYVNNDYESDMDMDVVFHPRAPIGAIEALMAAKKQRDEMKKMQEVEKMKRKKKPYHPVIKPLKDQPVEIVKKVTEQKPRISRKVIFDSSSEDNIESNKMETDVVVHSEALIESLMAAKMKGEDMNKTKEVEKMKKTRKPLIPVNHKPKETDYNQNYPGDSIEKIDSVHIVRNVTFTTRVSPGSSEHLQNKQDCVQKAKKRSNKRMADVDEIIQCNDMEVDNQQFQNKVHRTDKRNLSVEYDNEHHKRMKPSISSENQNNTSYDPPINYNFDQLKKNKLLNKFISQTNNNHNDQQHNYQESVMVKRTTRIQHRPSIDQPPSNVTQIINRTNFNVANPDIPSKLREHYETLASVASAEARKKIMNIKDGTADGIDKSLKESFSEGFAKIGNLNKDMKVHCLQHIQLIKRVHHSKRRLIELKEKNRES